MLVLSLNMKVFFVFSGSLLPPEKQPTLPNSDWSWTEEPHKNWLRLMSLQFSLITVSNLFFLFIMFKENSKQLLTLLEPYMNMYDKTRQLRKRRSLVGFSRAITQ